MDIALREMSSVTKHVIKVKSIGFNCSSNCAVLFVGGVTPHTPDIFALSYNHYTTMQERYHREQNTVTTPWPWPVADPEVDGTGKRGPKRYRINNVLPWPFEPM